MFPRHQHGVRSFAPATTTVTTFSSVILSIRSRSNRSMHRFSLTPGAFHTCNMHNQVYTHLTEIQETAQKIPTSTLLDLVDLQNQRVLFLKERSKG